MTLNEFIARATGFFDKAEAAQGGSKEVENFTAKISELNGKLTEATEDLKAKAAEIETLRSEAGRASDGWAKATGEIATLKASLEAEKKRIDETLAAMGVDPKTIPAEKQGKAETPKGKLAEYNAITDPAQKVAFYRKNKAEIDAAINASFNS